MHISLQDELKTCIRWLVLVQLLPAAVSITLSTDSREDSLLRLLRRIVMQAVLWVLSVSA